MGEFTAKFQAYLDQVKLIAPIELRTNGSTGGEHENYGTSGRNTFALSLSYSQIINQNFQVEFLADGVQQTGYLSLPFHRFISMIIQFIRKLCRIKGLKFLWE
jgi:hypothetical protein